MTVTLAIQTLPADIMEACRKQTCFQYMLEECPQTTLSWCPRRTRRLLYDVRATWDRGFADPKFNPQLLFDETFGGFPFRSFAICQADRRTHSRTPFPRTDDRCLLTTSASTLLSRLYDVLRFTSRWTIQDTTSHQRQCLVRGSATRGACCHAIRSQRWDGLFPVNVILKHLSWETAIEPALKKWHPIPT